MATPFIARMSFLVASLVLGCGTASADFQLSGNLQYWDGEEQIVVPMDSLEASDYLRYKSLSALAGVDINKVPPHRVTQLTEKDEKEHRYQLRFSEEEEEVRVVLEFHHTNYRGKDETIIPRFSEGVLHLKITRENSFEDALTFAQSVIENEESADQIIDAFGVLSAELDRGARYSFTGMKVLAGLLESYSQAVVTDDLPIRFATFLDNLDRSDVMEGLSNRQAYWVYGGFADVVSKNFNIKQPIGAGRKVHDIARGLLGNALENGYRARQSTEQSKTVKRASIANTTLRKARIECDQIILIEECMLTVSQYLLNFESHEAKDLFSFLSTLGTALEIESGFVGSSDKTDEDRLSRLRTDIHLKKLWSRLHCLNKRLNVPDVFSDQQKQSLGYIVQLSSLSEAINNGENCEAV
ncbi:hypothetical protein ACOTTU_19345 [Roseobacter sp. EG26]|uniref:hypothetical protein n=1 Tax=Roseobacter sp. EG26 TaxID=3412477 RepID=UPI003CE58C91